VSRRLLFPVREFEQRCAAIQSEMAQRRTDLLLLDQPEAVFHLVGYAMSEGFQQYCVVPRQGTPVMVVRSVDAGTCREHSWIDRVIGHGDWEDPIQVVAALVDTERWPCKQIGVDMTSYNLTVNRYEHLRQVFVDAAFDDYSRFLAAQRVCKSEREIAYLRRSSQIADETLDEMLLELRPGVTIRSCTALAAARIIERGGDPGVVGPITRNLDDGKMHAMVSDDRIHEGDVLHVELIPQYMGYASRIMRPVSMGPAPQEVIDRAARIIGLQNKQLDAMKPGVSASEIDAILRNGMLSSGLKSVYTNITGYNLGYYQLHTARSSDFSYIFRPIDQWALKPGMVFHMYTVASGLAFSETIRITEEGSERLTKTERNILTCLRK